MRYERTPRASSAIIIADLMAHMRTGYDGMVNDPAVMAECQALADAATMEIEAYSGISLTTQTITAWTDAVGGQVINLPVGPLAPDAVVTINGNTVATEGGRYPRVTVPDGISGAITIIWQAGYGIDAHSIPADLRLAVMDQAAATYDYRALDDERRRNGLSPAAARICARYRRVAV